MMMNYFGKILDGSDPNTRIDKTSWGPYGQTPVTPCSEVPPAGMFNSMSSQILGTYYTPYYSATPTQISRPVYNTPTNFYQPTLMPSVPSPVFGGDVVIGIPLISPTVERQTGEAKTKFTEIKPGTFVNLFAGMNPYTDIDEIDNSKYGDARVVTKYGVRVPYKPSSNDEKADLALIEASEPDALYVRIIHKSDTTLYLLSTFITIDQVTSGKVDYIIKRDLKL